MIRPIAARRSPDAIVLLIAIASMPLFLYGLGETYLWQDEAQTALLGRSVLRHGVPMVGVGPESLSAHMGADAGIRGIYFQISWLQAYVAAASLRIFGESSWSARLPFAIAGWLCVPLVAWVVRQAGGDRTAARIAALLTATSVPFIVCARQSRYYALTAAAALLVGGTYAGLFQHRGERAALPAWSIAFLASAVLLVLSFDVTAIGILGMLAVHWILFAPSPAKRAAAFWAPWAAGVAVLIAWIAVSLSAPMRHDNAGMTAVPDRLWHGTLYYAGQIDAHVMPVPIAAIAVLGFASRTRPAMVILAALAAGAIGGAMLSPYRFFRYIVPSIPFLFALSALGFAALAEKGRAGKTAAALIVAAVVTSSGLHVLSHSVTSAVARSTGLITVRERSIPLTIPLLELVRELREPPRGPIAAMVVYLERHARDGDVLVATYEELPLKFHTNLDVYGGETAQLPSPDTRPDWIWPRHRLKVYTAERAAIEWVERELTSGTYQRIDLPAIDRRWENREDPELHIFTNPGPPGPNVVLYRAVE